MISQACEVTLVDVSAGVFSTCHLAHVKAKNGTFVRVMYSMFVSQEIHSYTYFSLI